MTKNDADVSDKILIGISSCLLGEKVRYDGGHKNDPYIVHTLGDYFEFRAFCPEMSIGLGVPRETIRLVAHNDNEGGIRCEGSKDPGQDVTDSLRHTANEQVSWHRDIMGYILKKGSPSCGMERVKTYSHFTDKKGVEQYQSTETGVGIYAEQLMKNFPNLPVEEEGRLGDAIIRENFIERVFIYHRWRQWEAQGLTSKALMEFHGRHKLNLFARNQTKARELGSWLANELAHKLEQEKAGVDTVATQYIAQLMVLLKTKASRKNHVDVLEYIRGYLKNGLSPQDREELTEAIEDYRLGSVPLVVPITLLKHHFRQYPDVGIERSFYMSPHPKELILRNAL